MENELVKCPFDVALNKMAEKSERQTTKKADGDDDYDRVMWNTPEEEQP